MSEVNVDIEQEIQILELKLKAMTQEFDTAIGKDMVLGEVKPIFHELRLMNARLLELKKQHAGSEP